MPLKLSLFRFSRWIYLSGLSVLLMSQLCLAGSLQEMTSQWDVLLKTYVVPGAAHGIKANLVDYEGLSHDTRFQDVLASVKSIDYSRLQTPEALLSFWINVYNIAAIKMILDHPTVESIKDIGSFINPVWDLDAIELMDKWVSLDYIEHDVLRKTGDFRIHFAIVCASLSCPDLRMEAYVPDKVSTQLQDNMVQFLRNFTKGADVNPTRSIVSLSKLFSWFSSDFGSTNDIYQLIEKTLEVDLMEYKLSYLDYDWSVNRLSVNSARTGRSTRSSVSGPSNGN